MLKKLVSKREVLVIVGAIIGAMIVTILTVMLSRRLGWDFARLSGDTVGILNESFLVGIYSKMGIVLWGGAAVVFWMVLLYSRYYSQPKEDGRIILGFAVITSLLYMDDFFLLHENVISVYLKIPEVVMYLLYFGMVLYMMVRYYAVLSHRGLVIIALAFCFLGLSVAVDVFALIIEIPYYMIIEDGSKFIGICLWLVFALYYGDSVMKNGSDD